MRAGFKNYRAFPLLRVLDSYGYKVKDDARIEGSVAKGIPVRVVDRRTGEDRGVVHVRWDGKKFTLTRKKEDSDASR